MTTATPSPDRPVIRFDERGQVRYAHMIWKGHASKLRLPLLLWSLKDDDPRKKNLLSNYLQKLAVKFARQWGNLA